MRIKAEIDEQGSEFMGEITDYSEASFPDEAPVTLDFDATNIVGVARNFRIEDDKVVCECEIEDEAGFAALRDSVLAPGFTVKERDGEQVVVDDLLQVAFVSKHGSAGFDGKVERLDEEGDE